MFLFSPLIFPWSRVSHPVSLTYIVLGDSLFRSLFSTLPLFQWPSLFSYFISCSAISSLFFLITLVLFLLYSLYFNTEHFPFHICRPLPLLPTLYFSSFCLLVSSLPASFRHCFYTRYFHRYLFLFFFSYPNSTSIPLPLSMSPSLSSSLALPGLKCLCWLLNWTLP